MERVLTRSSPSSLLELEEIELRGPSKSGFNPSFLLLLACFLLRRSGFWFFLISPASASSYKKQKQYWIKIDGLPTEQSLNFKEKKLQANMQYIIVILF